MIRQSKYIPLKAMGKARPRVTRNGTFMPADYEKWRLDFRRLFGPLDVAGLLRLEITAWRKLPKRTKHESGDYCTAGPDTDNVAGAIMDALFEDDSKVVAIDCVKLWGVEDLIEVVIEEVG